MTTPGVQRKSGVHVRLAAESPKTAKQSHLNPKVQGRFARIGMAEDAIVAKTRTCCGFSFSKPGVSPSVLNVDRDCIVHSCRARRASSYTVAMSQASTLQTQRATLRQTLRHRRRTVPVAERIAAAQALADRLLRLPFAPTQGQVAGYWAMDGEIALHAWQLGLPQACTYCLPVLDGDRLRFAAWGVGQALSSNRFGIPEPAMDLAQLQPPQAMAMIVLPLVGFDTRGQRLGMGGGWYDRSLQFRQKQAAPPYLVGVGFDCQCTDRLVAQRWDVALDAVCTPSQTLLFDRHELSPA